MSVAWQIRVTDAAAGNTPRLDTCGRPKRLRISQLKLNFLQLVLPFFPQQLRAMVCPIFYFPRILLSFSMMNIRVAPILPTSFAPVVITCLYQTDYLIQYTTIYLLMRKLLTLHYANQLLADDHRSHASVGTRMKS